MEQPPQEPEQRQDDDLGEDHRQGPPGYDLDEQQAIEDLQHDRSDEGERERAEGE